MIIAKSAFTLRLSVLCLGLAAGVPMAAAQTAAPAPVGTAPAAPPPIVAPAPAKLSPAHLALAMEVVKLSGMSRSIDTIVPDMVGKARQLFTQMRPEVTAELEKSIVALQPEFDAQKAQTQRIAGEAFGSRLSEAELKDIEAFFKSTSGQRFVASQPLILDDMFRNLDVFSQTLSQFVVDKLREDLKKKGIPF